MHADHAGVELVGAVKGSFSHEAVGDRRLDAVGEGADLLGSPARTAPPPTKINGFLEFLIMRMAVSMSSSVIVEESGFTSSGSLYSYSQVLAVTSLVISTSTGPGVRILRW